MGDPGGKSVDNCTGNSQPLCKKASNHNANLSLEMYSFTL